MNAYTKLRMHLERHIYKRGQFKGSAPADSSRRGKSHFRVVKLNGNAFAVRYYSTDILTAYPDGRVVLDTNGWWDSSTTRLRLNGALCFAGFGALYMKNVMGASQPVLRVSPHEYKYYDGMEFDENGYLISPAVPFEMKRIDKEASTEFMAEIKESGFKDMFPLLYANVEPGTNTVIRIAEAITNANQAHRWSEIISEFKYTWMYNYKAGRRETVEKGDAKKCWAAIMAHCKKDMYVKLLSDKTVL